MRISWLAGLCLAASLVACGGDHDAASPPTPSVTPSTTAAPLATHTASPTHSQSPSPSPTATPDAGDPLSGGATTVFDATANAFGQPARNLPLEQRRAFFVGNAFFNRNWVTAPSSTVGSDGLGPVFNARSCSSCHFRDGRGAPPAEPGQPFVGLLFRLSIPGHADDGSPLPDPAYGGQLNQQAILGVPAEGHAQVSYNEVPGTYGDGAAYSLRRPSYEFVDLAFGPLDDEILVSPRTAPFIFGLGLLEALDESTVLAGADPDDANGDGISGRANMVWDRHQQRSRLGRFGWKSNQPSLEQQNAGAFVGDIGLTSDLFPDQNCTAVQLECVAAPTGGEPEIDQQKIDSITFYSRFLAVPARRDVADPQVRSGEKLFQQIGCTDCHIETLVTGVVQDVPEISAQRVHPYTDLLLHDMGPELADDRPDFLADGREWRTPPLWGVGLIETVNRHDNLLHDGRARGFAEAVLWHGGEAERAREAFRLLPAEDRAALVRFLESL